MRTLSMRRLWYLMMIVAVWTATSGLSRASDPTSVNLAEMTLRSGFVVTGVCISTTSRWDDAARVIMTDSIVRVDRYLKGSGPATMTITSFGGALPERNFAMTISEMVQFNVGEEALLFLTSGAKGSYTVYRMARGKLVISRDRATGARNVLGAKLESVIADINRIVQEQRRKPNETK